MKILLLCLFILVARFVEVYLVRMGTYSTIIKNEKWATMLDFLDESLGLLLIVILVVDRFYLPFSLCYIAGSVFATFAVAKRWPPFLWEMMKKRKRIYRKKVNFSTA